MINSSSIPFKVFDEIVPIQDQYRINREASGKELG